MSDPILAAPDTTCPDLALIQATVEWEINRLAYDGLPLNYPEAETDQLWDNLSDLESRIATCAATTLAGVKAKADVLRRLMEINAEVFPVELGNIYDLMVSIIEDLRLAADSNDLLTPIPPAAS